MTKTPRRARTIQPLLATMIAAAATVVVLIATRPAVGSAAIANGPWSWTADDLAVAVMWWGALVGSTWLALTTFACVGALAGGRTSSAHRIARFAPPLARRVLQAALVSTWALVPSAAYAAPLSTPITVHVDSHGRLTTGAVPRASTVPHPATRTPVRRNSTPTSTTTTLPTTTRSTTTPATITPSTTTPSTIPAVVVPVPSRAPVVAHSPTPPTVPVGGRIHVVVAGDNLWQIARTEVIRASGSVAPDDAQIAPYWRRVVAANRATLRSGDPSLIFPGEVVALP